MWSMVADIARMGDDTNTCICVMRSEPWLSDRRMSIVLEIIRSVREAVFGQELNESYWWPGDCCA